MIPREEEAQRVLDTAIQLHSAEAVAESCKALAAAISEKCRGKNPVIMPVMMGGMFAASEVIKSLDFPFELDYIHATRYRNETVGDELLWKVMPSIDLENRVVVVIDDILDEGHTLRAVESSLRAQNPADLFIAVLVDKQTAKRAPGVQVDMVGLQVADHYVFGCGMDYKGYWRQLPAIYAVAGSGE